MSQQIPGLVPGPFVGAPGSQSPATGPAPRLHRSGSAVRGATHTHRGGPQKNPDIPQLILLLILNYDGGIIATRKSLQAQDLTMTAE